MQTRASAFLTPVGVVAFAVLLMDPVSATAQTGAWTQRPVVGPSSRGAPGMVFDTARGVTVLYGGLALTSPVQMNAETWEWDGLTWTVRPVAGPPPGRYGHAMAYDSARGVTVVFGGLVGSNRISNGDTWEWNGTVWTQRSMTGPSARAYSAMVYDAARGVTLLFGGYELDPFNVRDDTWEWNGSVWTPRTVQGPSRRSAHAMVYDPGRALTVLFGGRLVDNSVSNETWEWNGVAWTPRPVSGPSARFESKMAYDSGRGVSVLFGGWVGSTPVNNDETWEWDGAAWTRRVIAGPLARHAPGMTYDSARGMMVLYGGVTNSVMEQNDETWERGACDSNVPVAWAEWTASGTNSANGHFATPFSGISLTYAGQLDFAQVNNTGQNYWLPSSPYVSTRAPNPPARLDILASRASGATPNTITFSSPVTNPIMALVSLGRVAQTTTYTFNAPFEVMSVGQGEMWPTSGTGFPQAPILRSGTTLSGTEGFGAIRFPGTHSSISWTVANGEPWCGFSFAIPTASGGPIFTAQPAHQTVGSGASVAFTATASSAGAFTYRWRRNGVNLTDDGRISGSTSASLLISPVTQADAGAFECVATNPCGMTMSNSAILTVRCVSWTRRSTSGPAPRNGNTMAYDSARGVMVLFGGQTASGNVDDTWEWNGSAWNPRPVSGPSARAYSAMAYDSARHVTVLFGGSANGLNDETWEWNGTAWIPRAVSGPSPRFLHAMAYDSARGVTVLFGGNVNNVYNDETWEWNGTAWTRRMVSGPPPRAYHMMAYDSARGVTVLFGGQNGNILGDTWEWNGSTWSQRAAGPPRFEAAMAYDAGGVTVLFGGSTGTPNGQTWEWNGFTWFQRLGAGPPPAFYPAMAYDSARAVCVQFGGAAGGNNGDTWELGAAPAASIGTQPASRIACPQGFADFAVGAVAATGPVSYQWQVQMAPNIWQALNGFSAPLPCGGGAFAWAFPDNAPSTSIGISPCPGSLVLPQHFNVRCVVTDACGTVFSNAAQYTTCPADFNCSGSVSVQDLFDFLAAWFMLAPAADFDASGSVTVQDLFVFLAGWFSGCP